MNTGMYMYRLSDTEIGTSQRHLVASCVNEVCDTRCIVERQVRLERVASMCIFRGAGARCISITASSGALNGRF
ncbi:hypothetical protein EVAR_44127_1 [Eumeta japonica]|uniref:Uncharacterized protein n=1 Tax=Eumeta variegata TaxID=151549 RepID=A0A4C1XNA4_EUMVA|nr:hypothetical protein EVAR_44127_1 [Eumeta japonica]